MAADLPTSRHRLLPLVLDMERMETGTATPTMANATTKTGSYLRIFREGGPAILYVLTVDGGFYYNTGANAKWTLGPARMATEEDFARIVPLPFASGVAEKTAPATAAAILIAAGYTDGPTHDETNHTTPYIGALTRPLDFKVVPVTDEETPKGAPRPGAIEAMLTAPVPEAAATNQSAGRIDDLTPTQELS